MRAKLLAGEACDLVILTAAQIGELEGDGRVARGESAPLGRVRTDLNLRSVYSFVTQTKQPKRERTLADRAFVFVAGARPAFTARRPQWREAATTAPNGHRRWIELALFPFAVILQVTPIVAIAPRIDSAQRMNSCSMIRLAWLGTDSASGSVTPPAYWLKSGRPIEW